MLRESLLEIDHELKVIPSAYAMATPAFSTIVEKHGAEQAIKIFTYIYFMHDPRSSYAAYDEKKRHQDVCLAVFGKDLKITKEIQKVIEEYSSTKTSAVLLLESAKKSITMFKQWLDNVDPEDDDYDPTKHMKLLSDMGKTINGLKDLEDAVKKEAEINDTFGGVVVNKYNE